jgi:RNA polymerase sigma-70 factor (ECF subfamily)
MDLKNDDAIKTKFNSLYNDYSNLVRSVLYKICGRSEIDDLVQEAFIRIWKGLSDFENRSQSKTWVYRITINVAQDYFRKRKKNKFDIEFKEQFISDDLESKKHVNKDLVLKALNELSLPHRLVIVMFHMQDLSLKEVAEVLKESEGTVKSRLHYARSEMKKYFNKNGVSL